MQLHNVDVEKVLPYKIFTMDGCAYCVRAKMLLNKHGIPFKQKHLIGEDIQKFKNVTKFTTLPQIYDGDENHIGGYTELYHHLEK